MKSPESTSQEKRPVKKATKKSANAKASQAIREGLNKLKSETKKREALKGI